MHISLVPRRKTGNIFLPNRCPVCPFVSSFQPLPDMPVYTRVLVTSHKEWGRRRPLLSCLVWWTSALLAGRPSFSKTLALGCPVAHTFLTTVLPAPACWVHP